MDISSSSASFTLTSLQQQSHSAAKPPHASEVAGEKTTARPAVTLKGEEALGSRGAKAEGDPASAGKEKQDAAAESAKGSTALTPEEARVVENLSARDTEVRVHERAHASVGGQYAGGANYEYTRGPDGRLYATAGEVSIDTAPISGDPQATIEKMRVIISAAMAPADPSTTDHQVAAKARALMAEAMSQLSQSQQTSEDEESSETEKADESSKVDSASAISAQSENSTQQASKVSGVAASSFQVSSTMSEREVADVIANSHLSMERRLVDTGAFNKLFPEGSVIEKII